jgi:serine protease inhibitor
VLSAKKKYHLFIITATILFAVSACTQEVEDPVFDYNLKSAKVIETNNNFGLELLKTIFENEDKPNIMISPTSVSIALGMTYNGAETTTKEAFEQVLNYEGLTREEVNEITKELISVLVTNVEGNLLEIANSLWNDEGFPIKQDFIDLNANYFDAEVRVIDLQTAAALEGINKWASDQTHGKIDEILDKIDPATAMILINAIYFNCVWETEFDAEDTREDSFFTEEGRTFGFVDMMQTESTFNAAFTEEFSAVELPYKNKKFSMYLFLPGQNNGVDELVQELDGATWGSWMSEFHEVDDLRVHMPKFKFDYDRSLGDDLKAMGLEIAFSGNADFSGMSDIPLFIDKVIHKTYIGVNEEGTEAAAVTAVVMNWESASPSLYFNRPFLFAITENSSKSILFIGKVSEPSYQK